MNVSINITYGLSELSVAVGILKNMMSCCSIFTFSGTIGSGKTTLVKGILQECGVTQEVTSPTFTYVQSYAVTMHGHTYFFHHFDLYRLETLRDFFAAGFDEYLYQPDSWSFIEWPELLEPKLKDRCCYVSLTNLADQKREADIKSKGVCDYRGQI